MARAPLRVVCAVMAFAACDDAAPATQSDITADGEVSPDTSRPDAPTPWIYPDDEEEVTPSLEAAAIEDAVAMAMGTAFQIAPEGVLQMHELLFPMPATGEDNGGCPLVLTYDYGTAKAFFWTGECTAADGTMFSGNATVAVYDDFVNEAGTFDGFEIQMSGRIAASDGTTFEGAGRAGAYAGAAGDLSVASAVIDGTFVATGPRKVTSMWLDGELNASLTVTAFTYVPTGGKSVAVVGGISGLDFPDGISAVSLDELTARQALAGASCERELGGEAGVRGTDGNWYDVFFDGAVGEQAQTPSELCDGCGATWFRGVDIGESCVDARDFFRGTP